MYRFFNALVVEEGERRSLKTSSIHSTAVKWFLLLNTDKAWAHLAAFIRVQDICLVFSAPYFLPLLSPQAAQCAPLRRPKARRRVSPGCCLSILDTRRAVPWVCPLFGSSLQAWSRGCHQREALPARGHWQCLETVLFAGRGGGVRVLLASSELRPRVRLNLLQCLGQPPPLPQMLVVPRLRNAGLEIWWLLSRLSFFSFLVQGLIQVDEIESGGHRLSHSFCCSFKKQLWRVLS